MTHSTNLLIIIIIINSAMITNNEKSRLNGPPTGCLVFKFLKLESIQSLSLGLYAVHWERTSQPQTVSQFL